METLTVIKSNANNEEVWRYSGVLLQRSKEALLIHSKFNLPKEVKLFEMTICPGDYVYELFFNSRWYNILEFHDANSGKLKGWYCDIARPAHFENGLIRYTDLALDLLVLPDGRQVVLDEDEFEKANLAVEVQQKARQGLSELQALFNRNHPFKLDSFFTGEA